MDNLNNIENKFVIDENGKQKADKFNNYTKINSLFIKVESGKIELISESGMNESGKIQWKTLKKFVISERG